MFLTLSFLIDIEDLYKDFFRPMGVSRSSFKKYYSQKKKSFPKGTEISLPIELMRSGEVSPFYKGKEIRILSEDDYFLSVEKPHGVHGHPLSYREQNTVLNFLKSRGYFNITGLLEGGAERGLLYRLDRETSGVLVFAKEPDSYREVRDDFHSIAREKLYWAIVEGKLEKLGTREHLLVPSGKKGEKQKEGEKGKKASLVIQRSFYNEEEDCSLVDISLNTGIRHQIRAQLSLMGHPLVGDELYGGRKGERLFLHARKYSFLFRGATYEFSCDEADLFDKFFDLNSCL